MADRGLSPGSGSPDSLRGGTGSFEHWHVEGASEGEDESWLLIYLDVITLLLVIFIVIMTMMDWDEGGIIKTVQHSSSPVELETTTGVPVRDAQDAAAARAEAALQAALSALGGEIEVTTVSGIVRVRINNEVLFSSGEAELTEQGLSVIADLAMALAPLEQAIAVEGHTDNIPIETLQFPSNWELSTARATRVVRHLVVSGIAPDRLRATGYAETRPIAENSTPAGRALNRRVELTLENAPRS